MKTPMHQSSLPILAAAALLLAVHSVRAEDNTGTGGTITYTDAGGGNSVAFPPYAGGYVVHKFTGSGTLNLPVPVTAEVLVVGGGGGGGKFGGGGGAGGLIYNNSFQVIAGSTSVTVGAGGTGSGTSGVAGANGSNSVFGSLTAIGGGGGGARKASGSPLAGQPGNSGGSGGGGSPADGTTYGAGGSGTTGQGTNGGTETSYGWGGCGGGGAGVPGGNASGNNAGNGGNGLAYPLVGSNVYYAGGGGGCTYSGGAGTAGTGGLGGGGAGGKNASGGNGSPNTGGGGGGGDVGSGQNGGSGGSGIVIIRYPYDAGSFGIALNSPTNNQTFIAGPAITATALVNQGMTYSVTFYLQVNGGGFSQIGAAGNTSPYSVSLDSLGTGTYDIYAKVTDSVAGTATSATNRFTVDGTPPTLAGADIVDNMSGGPVETHTPVTYTVTFSEDMDATTVSAADFGNAGSATFTIGTVAETSPGVFTVPVTATGAGTLRLKVNAGADLKDPVGNALNTTTAIADDTTLTVNPDTTAPTPAPLTWASVPLATSQTAIVMTASTATDPSGVEYFFECTAGGGHSSAWQSSATYTDTGLSPTTTYTYRVQARDKSPAQNPTGFSATASATTAGAATMAASATAPAINGLDIANYGAWNPAPDKWWAGDPGASEAKGQTFTTGATPVLLKAITYQALQATPTKTYTIRIGTVSGTTFTPFRSYTATQTFTWNSYDYITWTFATPVLLAPNTLYGLDVGMTSSTSGWQSGIPYLNITGNNYAGGVRYGSGINGLGTSTLTLSSGNDRVFHLDLEHPMTPYPNIGATVPAGDLTLSWTSLAPTTGTDVWVDVWFGTAPGAMTKVADAQQNLTSFLVNLPGAATYYWRIDSYLDGSPTGTPAESTVFNFTVSDSDSDGFPDSYELANTDPASATALNRDDDLDSDDLTNWQEYQRGTVPTNPDTDGDTLNDGPETVGVGSRPPTDPRKLDTDGDGLNDGAESNTGTWVDATNSGTNPTVADTDADGLKDGFETNTGNYVSTTNTGTNPLLTDSDSDGAGDWYEVAASFTNPNSASARPKVPYPLPDPDPLDTGVSTKPVKVYIMSGQSNMVGMGDVSGTAPGLLDTITKRENKFPNLLNGSNGWTSRNDVIYKGVISDTWAGPLTVADGSIGPELGFGHVMGYYHNEPVLLIKTSIGNRSLLWDCLPPGSARFNYNGNTYAGYGDSPNSWPIGGGPSPFVWYAGKQYDDFFLAEDDMGAPAWATAVSYPSGCQVRRNGVTYLSKSAHTSAADSEPGVGAQWATYWSVYSIENVTDILDAFATRYPSWAAQGFEIAGYVWWQGNKDLGEPGASRYETNLVPFIKQTRAYYASRYPGQCTATTPFVIATGCGDPGTSGYGLTVANAQLAMNDPVKYPEFAGNVKTMDTRGNWRSVAESPADQGYHYNRNAETYMLTGDALGRGMIDLLGNATPPGFTSWQTANGAAGQTLADDHDGDGVPNGIEWFVMGSNNSTGFTALPGTAKDPGTGNLSVTWTKAATFSGVYPTDFVVETSASLTGTWTPESLAPSGTVTITGNQVKYSFPSPLGAKKFARLKVTGP
jgi:alpha-galactosidase